MEQGDFMNIPFPDNTFDKIYAIEALCHAPDRAAVYKQICQKLKPGGLAAFYEWGTTDKVRLLTHLPFWGGVGLILGPLQTEYFRT